MGSFDRIGASSRAPGVLPGSTHRAYGSCGEHLIESNATTGRLAAPADVRRGGTWPESARLTPGSTAYGRLDYDAGMFGLDTVVVLLIVLAVVVVWRGPKMLPKWGEALGRGVKAARKEAEELRRDADGPAGSDGSPKP